jgi:type 2 lantibiotic biosynthesis protein LanM
MNTSPRPGSRGSADGSVSPDWWLGALRKGEPSSRPDWVNAAEQAVADAAPLGALPPLDSWPDAFALPFRPFAATVRDALIESAVRYLPPEYIDPVATADTYAAALERRLARIAVRILVHELDKARAANSLSGADGRQRFEDFLRRWSTPQELAGLFAQYPVLARLLGTTAGLASEAGSELLARFAEDRAQVVRVLLQGDDPGPVMSIEPGLGDLHRRGRSVSAVVFADGRRVVYKPRSQEAYRLFGEVVAWLNEKVPQPGLRAASVVSRPGYGWMEFIAGRPLPTAAAARSFYQREGVLLSALYAMHATDIHCENLIACGDQPVLIDVETLFHPTLPMPRTTQPDPAAEALNASVCRASVLPNVTAGEEGLLDRSGMGGDPGQPLPDAMLDWDPPATDTMQLIRRRSIFNGTGNRPEFDGRLIEPADYESAVLEGFRAGYGAITAARDSFAQLIAARGDLESRAVFRPSSGYARLLDESTNPSLMGDAGDRDAALDVLRQASAQHPLWRRLAEHEIEDLWAGDIPLLTGRPAVRDIWTSAGRRLPDLLGQSGLRTSLDKIAAMSEVDRNDQEWLISASLATRRPDNGHRGAAPRREAVDAVAAEPGRLLAAACGLADQIVARGMTCRGDQASRRMNWVTLQLVEDTRWMVLPMGAGLADGYLGVALFFAQLAHLTGIDRYAEVARRAIGALPELLSVLADTPELLAAVGCGGMEGLGGISYGLARVSVLLGDPEIRTWADSAVELAAAAMRLPGVPPGWTAGAAGCLAAMTAIRAELGSAVAADTARACAGLLSELVEETDGRCAPVGAPLRQGFAAGPAGIGWALSRFAAADGGIRYSRSGLLATWRAGETAIPGTGQEPPGWCSGTAGLLLARSLLVEDTGLAGLRPGLTFLSGRQALSDLSLCHGELGIAEAHILLAGITGDSDAMRACRHRAGLILGAIERDAHYCGTPGGIPVPGLLTGLAGIGYGLLRLGFADRVPSVLLLEPGPGTRPAPVSGLPTI